MNISRSAYFGKAPSSSWRGGVLGLMVFGLLFLGIAPVHAESGMRGFNDSRYSTGDIVVIKKEKKLYFMGKTGIDAFAVAVGKARTPTPSGTFFVIDKARWPTWFPPATFREKERLPRRMKGGEKNPLGSRAIYLDRGLIRIHGTNRPQSVGKAVSHGCIRMRNQDIEWLYDRVERGSRVFIE